MNSSRLKNTIRNMSWQAICQVLTLTLGVIFPKFIISVYGSEVNGLTSTIKHVLTLVLLVQAGLGTSATYLLYKPVEEKDKVKIASILMSVKNIYKYVSIGIIFLGFIFSFIIAFFIDSSIAPVYVFVASLLACLNSAITLQFTSACNLFFNANQEKHIVSIVSLVSNMFNYLLTGVILIFKIHFIYIYISNSIICILNVILLICIFNKKYMLYKPLENEITQVSRVKIKGFSYAALNEAAHSAVYGLITVIVSLLCDLKAASVLSVYMMVTSLLSTTSNIAYTSFVPSYGSLMAEGDIKKVNKVFEIFQFLYINLNTFLFMCAAYLIIPFVKIYTAGVTDINYDNSLLMILVIVYGAFYSYRVPYNNTVSVSGLFKETYLQPVICCIISIILMFALSWINYALILVGPIFFYLINAIYQHLILQRKIKGFNCNHALKHFFVSVLCISLAIIYYFINPLSPNNFIEWIFVGVVTGIVSMILLILMNLLFDRSSFKMVYKFFKSKFIRG